MFRGAVVAALICGCGRVGFDATGPSESGDSSGVPVTGDAAAGPIIADGNLPGDGAALVGDGGGGSDASGVFGGGGAIGGTAPDGKPFTTLASGYVIGHPKYPGEISIYMFSTPIGCGDIGFPGWGEWIPSGTQCIELDVPAETVTAYSVQGAEPPAGSNGFGRYRYAFGNGGDLTGDGTAGSIAVTSTGSDGSIAGTFGVLFDVNGPLTGAFDAVSCPTGYYGTFP